MSAAASKSLWSSIVVGLAYLPTHALPFFCGDRQNQEKGETEGG